MEINLLKSNIEIFAFKNTTNDLWRNRNDYFFNWLTTGINNILFIIMLLLY